MFLYKDPSGMIAGRSANRLCRIPWQPSNSRCSIRCSSYHATAAAGQPVCSELSLLYLNNNQLTELPVFVGSSESDLQYFHQPTPPSHNPSTPSATRQPQASRLETAGRTSPPEDILHFMQSSGRLVGGQMPSAPTLRILAPRLKLLDAGNNRITEFGHPGAYPLRLMRLSLAGNLIRHINPISSHAALPDAAGHGLLGLSDVMQSSFRMRCSSQDYFRESFDVPQASIPVSVSTSGPWLSPTSPSAFSSAPTTKVASHHLIDSKPIWFPNLLELDLSANQLDRFDPYGLVSVNRHDGERPTSLTQEDNETTECSTVVSSCTNKKPSDLLLIPGQLQLNHGSGSRVRLRQRDPSLRVSHSASWLEFGNQARFIPKNKSFS
ncbi:unnamed protein product [Protopolystoma xenopodis]|uniref:Uncharacterized protein n=1 Tax=Protopolystoma xenopodis TaxID=117903 RepID=A0A448WI29_9PLAT|nr:unnamed protein product [Protopolystoma xenopodis]